MNENNKIFLKISNYKISCEILIKNICNSLVGHSSLEGMVWDSIADAIASDRMNNQDAVYINDEKNAREPRNLSISIPVLSLISGRYYRDPTTGTRRNRTFSDLLLVMGITLDPTAFPTIADNPLHKQYHIENENSEATTQEINGKKNSLPLSKVPGQPLPT